MALATITLEPGTWLEACIGCDAPVVCDDGAPDRSPAVCDDPECRAYLRRILPREARCSGCDRPGAECAPRPDGSCAHCGAPATADWRDHYHPFRSTTD